MTFDLPDTSRSCTRRERSNTPLQALNLLNDPVFVEAAQALAARIQREAQGDDAQRLDHAFLLALSRPPKPEEAQRLLAYLQQQRALFARRRRLRARTASGQRSPGCRRRVGRALPACC